MLPAENVLENIKQVLRLPATFLQHEQQMIDNILKVKGNLGTSRTAVVQSGGSPRISLMLKTFKCVRQTITREEAIAEVSHLTRLNHAHIVRFIGTYVIGRELCILLYPVANYNLDEFLNEARQSMVYLDEWSLAKNSIEHFFPCLSSAVRHIHDHLVKHMDIKPQNILVEARGNFVFRPYVADFGIARAYNHLEDVQTDEKTSFNKRYAAPEVVRHGERGQSADIFSLGCVFFELWGTLHSRATELLHMTSLWEDTSYQANTETLQAFIARGMQGHSDRFTKVTLFAISQMVRSEPLDRPTAEQLHCVWKQNDCCTAGSVPLDALPRGRFEDLLSSKSTRDP
jgi:serine/threonine protein kinase